MKETNSNKAVLAWLRLFRAVNLPTVPGDIFAGAAVAVASGGAGAAYAARVCGAAAASVMIYMFGLADNDIAGAATDAGRPIPDGEVSLRAARVARFLCIVGATAAALASGLPGPWWPAAFALLLCIVAYNRTKLALLMGLCRGLDLLLGAAAAGALARGASGAWDIPPPVPAATLLWTLYIAGVTKYSEGEEADPARRRRVGALIGALVWLQLAAALPTLPLRTEFPFVAAQVLMIALLLVFKRLMPKVSAS